MDKDRQRLANIKSQLSIISRKDPTTPLLYKEAAQIFKRLGKLDSANKCTSYSKNSTPNSTSIASRFASRFTILPLEILISILSLLDIFSKLKLAQVSKLLRAKLHSHHAFWMDFDLKTKAQAITNTQFARIWALNQGRCERFSLSGPRKLTGSFIKDIPPSSLPRKLKIFNFTNGSSIPPLVILKFLSAPSLQRTLTSLDFSNYKLMDSQSINKIIKHLPSLECLNLSGCPLLDNTLFHGLTCKPPPLKTLILANSNINDPVIQSLSILFNTLESIDLSGCTNTSISSLEYLSSCLLLQSIDLSGINAKLLIGTNTFTNFTRHCCKLRSFKFRVCPYLCDQDILHLTHTCTSLTSLVLSGSPKITGAGIDGLSKLDNLNYLAISNCNSISIASFVKFLNTARSRIIYLDVSINSWVADPLIKLLAQCPLLTHLNVRGCLGISRHSVLQLLRKQGKRFKNLNVQDNEQVDGGSILALQEKFGAQVVTGYITNLKKYNS